jgi:predicted N-formylglutamate amidohydrolase
MTLKPEILRPGGSKNLVFVCDHASNYIPPKYHALGLTPEHLSEHIAWDIGAGGIARNLSAILDAPAVLGAHSRLVIDTNRDLDSPTLIAEVSDGVEIPGNRKINERDRNARIRNYYEPFHAAVDVLVRTRLPHHPLVFGVHTFSPVFGGKSRVLEFAVLWNQDDRLAQRIGTAFEAHGYKVGWNEPYSGKSFFTTLDRHGHRHALPHVTVEVRNDLVDEEPEQRRFAEMIAVCLREISLKGL